MLDIHLQSSGTEAGEAWNFLEVKADMNSNHGSLITLSFPEVLHCDWPEDEQELCFRQMHKSLQKTP